MEKRVSFFIAGVQKGGTTALFDILSQHNDVCFPERKELHFFDNESLDWAEPPYELLHAAFAPANDGALLGEATPIYVYWPNALERLKAYNPNAKIILLLRHPTFRAYSQWRMETTRGDEPLSFEACISEIGRDRVRIAPGGAHRVHSYVERGFYADQLQRIYSLFPKHQVLVQRTDHLWARPEETLQAVSRFLDLSGSIQKTGYVTPYEGKTSGSMTLSDRRHLDTLFRSQIMKTQEIANIDLSDWLSEDYAESIPQPLNVTAYRI